MSMTVDERKRIMALADRFRVSIPGSSNVDAWPVYVLEAIEDKLRDLDQRLCFLEPKPKEPTT